MKKLYLPPHSNTQTHTTRPTALSLSHSLSLSLSPLDASVWQAQLTEHLLLQRACASEIRHMHAVHPSNSPYVSPAKVCMCVSTPQHLNLCLSS